MRLCICRPVEKTVDRWRDPAAYFLKFPLANPLAILVDAATRSESMTSGSSYAPQGRAIGSTSESSGAASFPQLGMNKR
jgi:hypothetical protein